MSSRVFQSVIIQIKEATDRCIGIIDDQGFVTTCRELTAEELELVFTDENQD